jgi:hypothetical protein
MNLHSDSQGPSLPAEQAKKLLRHDVANIVRKVAGGRPLSRSERASVEAQAAGGARRPERWARNVVELATALGVHRSSLHHWRHEPGAPMTASNGRHDIEAWKDWIKRTGKRVGAGALPDRLELQRKNIALQCDKLSAQILELKRDYTPMDQVWEELRVMMREAREAGESMPTRLAPALVGLAVADVEKRLREWWDDYCRSLHLGTVPRG